MSLHERLYTSSRRWATMALDAYKEDPPDLDFAVHHMAVAVEHLSKAYLCSISEVLLFGGRCDLDDLLILAGHEDKANRKRSQLKTIGGDEVLKRVGAILREQPADSKGLKDLREVRNGITHLGEAPAEARPLLAAGITYLNVLLSKLERPIALFWGGHEPLTARLVVETVTDRQLHYESKIQAAQERFRRRFGKWPDAQRAEATSTLSLIPGLFGFSVETDCPACGTSGPVAGTNYSRGDGPSLRVWSDPTDFSCQRCGLTLKGDELELAGIFGFFLDDHEEEGSVWWPSDSDDLTNLPEWDADHEP